MVIKIPTGSPSSLRRVHRALAMREMLKHGGVSRTALAERLGLSTMAAGRIVRELVDSGLVREGGTIDKSEGPGRRQTKLEMRADGIYAAGIVASAYYKEIAVVDSVGSTVAEMSVPVRNVRDGPKTIEALCRALKELIERSRLPTNRVAGIGGSFAAVVDPVMGSVVSAGYLGWEPFSLKDIVASITGLPFVVENIPNTSNRAESFLGVSQTASTVAVVHTATTLGASFSLNGNLLRGNQLKSGRLGHFPFGTTDLTCSCGRNDCLNCSASGWSTLNRLGILRSPEYDPDLVETYATEIERLVPRDRPDHVISSRARAALFEAGSALGDGLWNIELTYDPELIVLVGSLTRAQAYLDGAVERLFSLGSEGRAAAAKIVVGKIAPARAAAMIALDEFVYSPRLELPRVEASADHAGRPQDIDAS